MSLLKTPTLNFEKTWEELQAPLVLIVSGIPQTIPNDKWLGMYTSVYKMCTNPGAPQSEMLFFRLRSLLVQHVEQIFEQLQRISGEVEFLKRYCASFQSFTTGTQCASELFGYLNRYWIKYSHCETGQAPIAGVYPVQELALHIWHDTAFTRLKKKLVDSIICIFRTARDDRNECFDDGEYIADAVKTYFTLGAIRKDAMDLYREDLEMPFLQDTAAYYSALAKALLSKVTISQYLEDVELLCKQEQRRCENGLHRTTMTKARQVCCRVLVDEHAERICEDAEHFLVNNQTQDLHRLFSLFSELPKDQALISFKNILKKYIERSGLDVVRRFEHEEAAKNPEGYIEALVQVRNKYFELIKDAFEFHALMRTALDQACRAFANSHPGLPELLAKYTHYLMTHNRSLGNVPRSTVPDQRNQLQEQTVTPLLIEESLEQKIENISVVFCLIDDKDVFKKYYAKFLAKRLIKGTSIANDLEVLLIQKLREICGGDFVSKLQKMLKDKALSKDLMQAFDTWIVDNESQLIDSEASNKSAIEFHHRIAYHCDVLTAGAWPIASNTTDIKLQLPPAVATHMRLLSEFYTQRSTGRKLMWVHHLSFGVLQANCFHKRYEFALSFFQMLILLQFNDADELSLETMEQALGIPGKDLLHHIENLLKVRVVEIGQTAGMFKLNLTFSSKKTRLSAVPKSPVQSPKVTRTTPRAVEEDRKMALQAAIVRVLKTRRDIMLPQLQVDVAAIVQNQFVPSVTALNQNIEILIRKEFIRRHESNPQRFLYVA